MRIFSYLCFFVAIVGILLAVATFPAESSFSSRARLVQRMRIDDASSLFGEEGTPIGSPQKLIIDDPKAFNGKKTADGAEIVDEGYLEKNQIYPLQMQTVSYVSGLARIGGVTAFLVAGLVGLLARRRVRAKLDET